MRPTVRVNCVVEAAHTVQKGFLTIYKTSHRPKRHTVTVAMRLLSFECVPGDGKHYNPS